MALNSASTTSDSESEVSEVGIYNIKTDDLVFYSWHWSKSLLKKKSGFVSINSLSLHVDFKTVIMFKFEIGTILLHLKLIDL